jgi:hypothetical protein
VVSQSYFCELIKFRKIFSAFFLHAVSFLAAILITSVVVVLTPTLTTFADLAMPNQKTL